MKNWFKNRKSVSKRISACLLCFLMLSSFAAAMAQPAEKADTVTRSENIDDFGDAQYTLEYAPGEYLAPGTTLRIDIQAKENAGEKLLFALEEMFYQLPKNGLTYTMLKPSSANGYTLNIYILDPLQSRQRLLKAIVTVNNSTGRLNLEWDTTSDGYEVLDDVSNAEFSLAVEGRVNGDSDVIEIDSNHRYYVDNTKDLRFTKSFGPAGAEALILAMHKQEPASGLTFTTSPISLPKPDLTNAETEYKDSMGFVRSKATGKIVYLPAKAQTISLNDMQYENGYFYYDWNNVKPDPDNYFTVTENSHIDLSESHYTYNEKNQNTAQSTEKMTPYGSTSCSLVNTYTQDSAELKINKNFAHKTGSISDTYITAGNITGPQKSQIIITVAGKTANNEDYSTTFTYADMENGSYTLQLPVGTYTVTESAQIDNHKWVIAQYKLDNGSLTSFDATFNQDSPDTEITDSSVKVENIIITKNTDRELTLTNGYVKDTGSLKLKKTFLGSLPDNKKKDVTFHVTHTVGNRTKYVWFKSGGPSGRYEFAGLSDSMTEGPGEFCSFDYSRLESTSNIVDLLRLPLGNYTVHESKNNFSGYERTSTYTVNGTTNPLTVNGAAVTLNKDNANPNMELFNTYTPKGSLTLSKSVVGVSADKQNETSFQLKGPDGNAIGEPVKYSQFTSGSYTWSNLEYGQYTIEEVPASVDHYTLQSTTHVVTQYVGSTQTSLGPIDGVSATVNVSNPYAQSTGTDASPDQPGAAAVAFTNTYAPITTSLKLKKSFGSGYPLPDGMTTLNSTLHFKVKAKNGGDFFKWNVQNGVYVLSTDGSGSDSIPYSALVNGEITLSGLPVGQQYTVEEFGSGLDGYRLSTTINGTAVSPDSSPAGDTGVLVKDQTDTFSFHNEYHPYATLRVSKTFITNDLPDDYCNDVILPELRFVVFTKENNTTMYVSDDGFTTDKSKAKRFAYSTLASGQILDGNKTYYVEEENADLGGKLNDEYIVTTQTTIDSEADTLKDGAISDGVTLAPDSNHTVDFKNTYTKKTTSGIIPPPNAAVLINHKSWTGLDSNHSVKGDVRFRLSRKQEDGSWNEHAIYTLTELTSGGKNLILLPGTYLFEELYANVTGYERKSILDIVYNTHDNDPNNNVIIPSQDIAEGGAEFTVEAGDVISFSLANNYIPLGQITVTKTINQSGDLKVLSPNSQRGQVSFTLYFAENEDGDPDSDTEYSALAGRTFTLENASFNESTNTYTYTFSNLPVGQYVKDTNGDWSLRRYYYKVQETNSVTGYSCTTSVTLEDAGSVRTRPADPSGTVQLQRASASDSTGDAVIHFDNTFTRDKGSLVVTKAFTQGEGLTEADRNKVIFELLSGNEVKHTFTFADMTKDPDADTTKASYTISDLPTGSYVLRERNANTGAFLRTTSFIITNSDGTTNSRTTTTLGTSETDDSPAINVGVGTPATAAVENAYTSSGAVNVKKTFRFVGNAQLPDNKRADVSFILSRKNPDGSPTTIRTVTLADSGVERKDDVYTYTFSDLPVGDYIVTERITGNGHAEYSRTTTVTVDGTGIQTAPDNPFAEVSVGHGESREVEFVNTYEEYGKLRIMKEFDGINSQAFNNASKDVIVYAIRDAQGSIVPAYDGPQEDRDDNLPKYVIINGETVGTVTQNSIPFTRTNLPAGYYTVEEIIFSPANPLDDPDNIFYGHVHSKTSYTVSAGNMQLQSKEESRSADDTEDFRIATDPIRVGAQDATVAFTNTYRAITPLSVVKECDAYPVGATENGLPIWEFNVTISNLSQDNTVSGVTTLTDVFDVYGDDRAYATRNAHWFKLCTEGGYAPAITSNNGGKVLSYTSNNGVGTFEIAVKDDNGVAAGDSITLTYYLQVANKKALSELTAPEATENSEGKAQWAFLNAIWYRPMPEADPVPSADDYYYALSVIEKSREQMAENSTRVTFTLDVNPNAVHIGSDKELTIYDNMEGNLTMDMTSFKVVPAEYAHKVKPQAYTGEDKRWDLIITVPNEVHLTISYDCIFTANGEQTISNEAQMIGVTDKVEEEIIVSGEGDGSASLTFVNLFKHGASIAEPLSGAEFKLYEISTTEAGEEREILAGTYTTGENGNVWISNLNAMGDIGIQWKIPYVLRESRAPRGFKLSEKETRFTLVESLEDEATANLPNRILTGKTLPFENSPQETSVELKVSKQLLGRSLEEGQFSFYLNNQNGTPLQDPKQNDANGNVVFDPIRFSYSDLRQESAGKITYAESKEFVYTITEQAETDMPGYVFDETVITVTVTLSLAEDGTLQATPVYTNAAGEPCTTFVNTYGAVGSAILTGTKTVQSASAVNDEYSFLIKDENNVTLCTARNAVNTLANTAEINYPAFVYAVDLEAEEKTVVYDEKTNTIITMAASVEEVIGSYRYTISEEAGSAAGIVYDTRVYDYTVTVSDAGDGRLLVDANLSEDGAPEEDVEPDEGDEPGEGGEPDEGDEPDEGGTTTATADFFNTYIPPVTYDYKFSFRKVWQGGVEDSISWTLYNADGEVVRKGFNKRILSETEWYYEAWFESDKGYYIIEDVPAGYVPIYINAGPHAGVKDRVLNGGTIVNYKVPETGDASSLTLWLALLGGSAAALTGLVLLRKRRASKP